MPLTFVCSRAEGKTGMGVGVGDYRVKPGDWELRGHVNEVCCFDSKLEWVKVCLKFEDAFFCALLQWWDFLIGVAIRTGPYR